MTGGWHLALSGDVPPALAIIHGEQPASGPGPDVDFARELGELWEPQGFAAAREVLARVEETWPGNVHRLAVLRARLDRWEAEQRQFEAFLTGSFCCEYGTARD